MLLERIEQTIGKLEKPTTREIKQAILSLGSSLEEIPAHATEPELLPYGRNILFRNDDLEVVVIHLPGYCRTAIHDHGDAVGCMFVAQGELMNIEYRLDPNGFPEQNDFSFIKNKELCSVPYGQIHELVNPNSEPVISLHVYTPSLIGAKRYKPFSEVLDFVI